jgi:carbonic anhydrase/acetyltransferase-like protein (isoleucine patch superfamily)
MSFEDVQKLSHKKKFQFICLTSDIVLKQQVVEYLKKNDVHFFSVVHKTNALHVRIGRGTFVNAFNLSFSSDNSMIGDHVVIASHCLFSHDCTIDDFCHVSSYTFLSRCYLKTGSCVGIRTSIICDLHQDKIIIPAYTNLIVGSTLTQSLKQAGTYLGHRKISCETSLEKRIV